MATAHELELPLGNARLTRSDLTRVGPVRYGGRGPVGHPRGTYATGVGYWTGVVEFERQSTPKHPAYGIGGIAAFEAAVAEIAESGSTFKVPMTRKGQWAQGLATFVNRADASDVRTLAEAGTLMTGAGGIVVAPTVGAVTIDVRIVPGTRLTLDNALYMARPGAGVQTITATKPDTIPAWPEDSGETVEIDFPWAVGRAALNAAMPLMRYGYWGGGWRIEWEEQ